MEKLNYPEEIFVNYKFRNKNKRMNPIIKEYVPFVVKQVLKKTEIPKTEDDLIQFCQALTEQVIKRIEPIKNN